jgi:hypothetical protein
MIQAVGVLLILKIISNILKYLVLSSFKTYHRICDNSNTMGATRGVGTTHSSGAHVFVFVLLLVLVRLMLSNYIVFMFSIPCCDVRYDIRVKRWSIRVVFYYLCRISCFIYVICIYLRVLVSNTISISEVVRVV